MRIADHAPTPDDIIYRGYLLRPDVHGILVYQIMPGTQELDYIYTRNGTDREALIRQCRDTIDIWVQGEVTK